MSMGTKVCSIKRVTNLLRIPDIDFVCFFVEFTGLTLFALVLGSRLVLILTFPCLGLDLGLELWTKSMDFHFVPGLDLGTSGLKPNTGLHPLAHSCQMYV